MRFGSRRLSMFVSPAFPLAVVSIPTQVYLPVFYADTMGLGLTAVGAAFLFARIWDIVTDPLAGLLSDRVKLPSGRRRGWMLVGTPILMVGAAITFFPTEDTSFRSLVLGLLVFYLGFTFISVNHNTLASEIAVDQHDRSRLMAAGHIAFVLGTIVLLALPSVLEIYFGGGASGTIASMGWVLILLLSPTMIALMFAAKDPELPKVSTPDFRVIKSVLTQNRAVRHVLIADLCGDIGLGVSASLFLFFMKDVMALGNISSVILLCFFISAVMFVPVWLRVRARTSKEMTVVLTMVLSAAVLPLIYLAPTGTVVWALMIVVAMGVPSGALPFLLRAMIGDAGDAQMQANKQNTSGVLFALLTMTNKAGYALAIGIAFSLLDLFGFVPGAENSAAAKAGMLATFIWAPFVFYLIAAASILVLTKQRTSLSPGAEARRRSIRPGEVDMRQVPTIMNVTNQLYFIPILEWSQPHPASSSRGEDPAWHIGHITADYARSIVTPLTGDASLETRYDAAQFKTSGQAEPWRSLTPTMQDMINWFIDVDVAARILIEQTPGTHRFDQMIDFFTTTAETLEEAILYMIQHNAFHMGKVHQIIGYES